MNTIHVMLLSLVVSFSQMVSAHPGHGMGEGHGNEGLHPFIGPDQLLLFAALGALFLLVRKGLANKRSDRDQE